MIIRKRLVLFQFTLVSFLKYNKSTSLLLWIHTSIALQWRRKGHDGVSMHHPPYCSLNHLFRRRSKRTPKLRVTGLFAWTSPLADEFPAQMASNAENVFIWWCYHGLEQKPVLTVHGKLFEPRRSQGTDTKYKRKSSLQKILLTQYIDIYDQKDIIVMPWDARLFK